MLKESQEMVNRTNSEFDSWVTVLDSTTFPKLNIMSSVIVHSNALANSF